jgi:hypothetical protein
LKSNGNIQSYTFGGKKRINGNKLEKFVKKEMEMRNLSGKEDMSLADYTSTKGGKSSMGTHKDHTSLMSP